MASETSKPEAPNTRSGYFQTSESARASLYFLIPFVLFYELGTWYFTFDASTNTEQRIVAFSMLRDSLAALGATARWVAPASVISILIGLTIFRREKVRITPLTLCGMFGESLVLAIPLILISLLLARVPWPMLAGFDSVGSDVVLSVGAGIYEELIFRLIGFAVLHFLLSDFLGLRASVTLPAMVVLSGLLFSLYHYWGPEPFAVQTFVFRAIAGSYFGMVMLWRGFGITAGCHAGYDILICILRGLSHDAS